MRSFTCVNLLLNFSYVRIRKQLLRITRFLILFRHSKFVEKSRNEFDNLEQVDFQRVKECFDVQKLRFEGDLKKFRN